MTREELKKHCEKQVEYCEMWAKCKREEPHGKVYEEHKLILELLEQQPCEDCISRREAIKMFTYNSKGEHIPDYDCDNFPVQIAMKTVKEMLRDLPPVSPQPKMGKWITLKDEYGDVTEAVCSCCDKNGNHKWAFCPYCGQPKMQEVEE